MIVDNGKIPSFPDGMTNAIETWRSTNPEYKVKMYSGEDCLTYIKTHFDDRILETYNTLLPYSYKCDFMRHLILYQEGGWYTDMRMICLRSLESLNTMNKNFYACIDTPPKHACMYTGFIGAVPKHPISKKMIDLIVWNVSQRHYGLDSLFVTGPGAYIKACIDYVRAYPQKCEIGRHIIQGGKQYIYFGNLQYVKVKYNDCLGGDNTDIPGTNNYGKMWRNRAIYLKK